MNDCRLAPGVGLVDTRLFVAGELAALQEVGCEAQYCCAGGSDRMSGAFALNTLEWYDIPSNQWRRGNNMNTRRQGCCCCVVDGLLYGADTLNRITMFSDIYLFSHWRSGRESTSNCHL